MKLPTLVPATIGAAVLAAAIVGMPVSANADSGSGSTAPTAPTAASIITPLLKIFDTGDATGLPLACNLATSLILTGASQFNAGSAVTPLSNALVDACNKISSTGDGYLSQAISQSAGLGLINPVVDPQIASLATGVTTTGTTHAQALAPFGPTISGLGGDIAFFEGN